MAPEVLLSNNIMDPASSLERYYTESVDIWSVGVVMFCLLYNSRPFQSRRKTIMFEKIKQHSVKFPDRFKKRISEEAEQLVKQMMGPCGTTRPSAKEALNHPWFSSKSKKKVLLPLFVKTKRNGDLSFLANCVDHIANSSDFKKLSMLFLMSRLPSKKVSRGTKAFKKLDCTKDGIVSYDDFKQVMAEQKFPEDETRILFNLLVSEQQKTSIYKGM